MDEEASGYQKKQYKKMNKFYNYFAYCLVSLANVLSDTGY